MCFLKKQDMELLENQNIFNSVSKTDIEKSLSSLSFLFLLSLSLTLKSERDSLFFANIRSNLQSIRSSNKILSPKLKNREIVSQCNSPPSSLLTIVKNLSLNILKGGAFLGLLYLGMFRKNFIPKPVTQTTSGFASIGASICSNISTPSESLLNETMENKNDKTFFVVNPLCELGMNSASRNLRPARPVQMIYEVHVRQTAVVIRSQGGALRYYRNEQLVQVRAVCVAAHAPQPRFTLPKRL